MSFWVEILIWSLGPLILEPPLLWLIDRFQKKKHNLKTIETDPNNFIIKQNRDMKGMAWLLGGFIGGSTLLVLILLPVTVATGINDMSKIDLIIASSIFVVMLLIVIWLMFRTLVFKAEIRDNELYIYSLFRLRRFEIAELTTQAKVKGYYKYFEVYHENKRILKVNYSMINYDLAKNKLGVKQ